MDIILSTRNPSKAEQIKAVFSGMDVSILTLSEAGIEGDAIEDGATLQENALKKARFAHELAPLKQWTMADDTGLFIWALNGEPGIRAARWAGENVPTEQTTDYCLKRLKGVADCRARFETVVAMISPERTEHFFVGSAHGSILEVPRVPPQPKMPHSCLFVPEGQERCWAEMTVEEENAISHRGIAFGKVRAFLEHRI